MRTAPSGTARAHGGQGAAEDLSLLLASAGRGDQAAFARLYDATAAGAYALALELVPNAARAEEVTQLAFVDVWRHAALFDPALGEPAVWITAIVRRRALQRARLIQGEHAELLASRSRRSLGRAESSPLPW